MQSRSTLLVLLVILGAAASLATLLLLPEEAAPGTLPAATTVQPSASVMPAPPELPLPAVTALPGTSRPLDGAREPLAADGLPTLLTGRAVDRFGVPVVRATVSVYRAESTSPFATRTDLGTSVATGPDGRFELLALPPDTPLGIEVRAEGLAPVLREIVRLAAGEQQDLGDLVLPTGLLLGGTVRDALGVPLPGALIAVRDVTADQRRAEPGPPVAAAESGADGRYAVAGLGARQYSIDVGKAGYASVHSVMSFALGTPDDTWTMDVRLDTADQPLGGIVQGADGRPVAGATLRLTRRPRRANTYVLEERVTTEGGSFLFESLAEGEYEADLVANDWYLEDRLALEAGRTDHLVVARPALAVEGTLVAPPGTLLPATFEVTIKPDGRSGAGLAGRATHQRRFADGEPPGRFLVDGLRPGTFTFEVEAPGFAVTRSHDLLLGADTPRAEVFIPLSVGGSVIGRLVPPAAGVAVELRENDYDPALVVESTFPTPPVHGLAVRTDADGRFRFEHVPPGSFVLSAWPPEAPPVHRRDVVVAEAATTDAGDLGIDRGGTILGRLFGDDGLPSAGARINASNESHQQQALTDAAGSFRLAALPPGRYTLVATPAGLWEALRLEGKEIVDVASGQEVEVALRLAERLVEAPR